MSRSVVDEHATWRRTHESVRQLEQLPNVSWCTFKCLKGIPWNSRARDCIEIAYCRFHKLILEKERNGEVVERGSHGLFKCEWILDISQTITRKAHSLRFRAMCSSSTYYSFSLDRMITAPEHLLALGWPREGLLEKLGQLSPSQIRDLAGESMAPPAIGAVMASLALSLPLFEQS